MDGARRSARRVTPGRFEIGCVLDASSAGAKGIFVLGCGFGVDDANEMAGVCPADRHSHEFRAQLFFRTADRPVDDFSLRPVARRRSYDPMPR